MLERQARLGALAASPEYRDDRVPGLHELHDGHVRAAEDIEVLREPRLYRLRATIDPSARPSRVFDVFDLRVPPELREDRRLGHRCRLPELLPQPPGNLDVLLRHRLLREPHGFEGFVRFPVVVDRGDLALAKRVHLAPALRDRSAAPAANAGRARDQEDAAVVQINQAFHLEPGLEGLDQLPGESEDGLAPLQHLPREAREATDQAVLDIFGVMRDDTLVAGVEAQHQTADDLYVLLRHRPPSIPDRAPGRPTPPGSSVALRVSSGPRSRRRDRRSAAHTARRSIPRSGAAACAPSGARSTLGVRPRGDGFGTLRELVHADDPAVAEGVDVVEAGVDRHAAPAPAALHPHRHDHALAHVHELLRHQPVIVPFAFPMREARPNSVVPPAGQLLDRVPHDAGIGVPQRLVDIRSQEAAHDLHVCLRHGAPSIPPQRAAARAAVTLSAGAGQAQGVAAALERAPVAARAALDPLALGGLGALATEGGAAREAPEDLLGPARVALCAHLVTGLAYRAHRFPLRPRAADPGV